MGTHVFFDQVRHSVLTRCVGATLCVTMAVLPLSPVMAQAVIQTPATPMELPIETEIELSPAGSLKQAPLWKELIQMLKNPGAPVVRRPGFGVAMPPLNVYPNKYNFLTGQPMRLRTSDGETSWDQPGPLYDQLENVATDAFNTPLEVRNAVVGHLVACPNIPAYGYLTAAQGNALCNGKPRGSLVVHNSANSSYIPEHGTVVAVAAVVAGRLQELAGESTTDTEDIVGALEIPVNEEDFFRLANTAAGVPNPLRPYVGRVGAEVLGKALFWDMQVGSDGVQACGSCHFHAGVDNRTRGQLNPNTLGGDVTLQIKPANTDVVAGDFPFRRLADLDAPSEGPGASSVVRDANDVMASMGVSRFKLFRDIPAIGAGSFGTPSAIGAVRPLRPDLGVVAPDPVTANDGFRRVEPRHTPTFHGAAFNLDNFWDGRARFNFNGGSVFGPSDPTAHIFIDPGDPNGPASVNLQAATMGHLRDDLITEDPEVAEQPVRIKFSSLGSQAVGPPLSDFEMSFAGRNWAKIGKKMLQGDTAVWRAIQANEVTPLANQLVAISDSRLGPFSNQGGSVCALLGRPTTAGKPGLCISYGDLVRLAFSREYWQNSTRHLKGCYTDDGDPLTTQNIPVCPTGTSHDPFDGYMLTNASTSAAAANRNQFSQMEANFSMFFALAAQAYQSLVVPDHTPADRFFDANPLAGNGVGEPGDQAVLFPTLIPGLVNTGTCPAGTTRNGVLCLIPDNPATPDYDGFGPDEVFGFDIFAGANLTAALQPGSPRNPRHAITRADGSPMQIAVGSNPFTRSAKCMLCHLGAEQTDHSINISHGLLKNDAEFEYPTPPFVADPDNIFGDGRLPAPEPSGLFKAVGGLILAEEVEETPQDAVEVEPRNFAMFDDPATPWDDRVVAQPGNFAFGDQGVYNIGLRPNVEDTGRGGDDAFGQPLSLAALTLKNIGGPDYEPCDGPADSCVMSGFDPSDLGATFEESGDDLVYPGSTHDLQSINPGYERSPITPLMPAYMVPWINGLPAGELHPQIDEMAGMAPNTLTPPNGGPGIEFPEVMFGADQHCATYDPAVFGSGPPNFGWGATDPATGELVLGRCPQNQSGAAGNFDFPVHGTWPVPNRVLRDGAFKAPALRNVELTGPYFHTGSYLTLRQVVDFYVRGGDFPITNAESRDPHVVNLTHQAFAFGRTTGADLTTPVNYGVLIGVFADGLPDTQFLYDAMPDTDHAVTPEYATPEEAKIALVKFMLSLTDPRVKYERAPFDRPEIFVPIDGLAPENTGGRAQLVSQSGVACPATGSTGICFRQIPATGATGNATPLQNFLAVTNNPAANCTTEISHFCR